MCTAFVLADGDGGLLGKIVEGVLVSLIVAAIILAITSMWRGGRAFINRLFGFISVQGHWTTELTRSAGPQQHEQGELNQFFNRVWGKTWTWPKPPDGKVKTYEVKGWIQGQRLILTYHQTDGPGFDSGACVLFINNDGENLIGFEVGPDTETETEEIKAFRYEWTKAAPGAARPS